MALHISTSPSSTSTSSPVDYRTLCGAKNLLDRSADVCTVHEQVPHQQHSLRTSNQATASPVPSGKKGYSTITFPSSSVQSAGLRQYINSGRIFSTPMNNFISDQLQKFSSIMLNIFLNTWYRWVRFMSKKVIRNLWNLCGVRVWNLLWCYQYRVGFKFPL